MSRYLVISGLVTVAFGCGGGKPKKAVKTPAPKPDTGETAAKPETETDRESNRLTAAQAIIPAGSSCLPTSLKEPGAPRLELAAVETTPMLCAFDTDSSRLLGPVGCFKLDLGTGGLAYEAPRPLPGIGFAVKLDDNCARGFCLPKTAKLPADKRAHLTWSTDSKRVAALVGEEVHVFEADSKAHQSTFSIRGDKGVPGDAVSVHWVGDALFVEGAEGAGVWVYKPDGTAVGPIEVLGGKAGTLVSTKGGSLSVLDKNRVGITEQGFTTMTTYEVDTGKRGRVSRKVPKAPCKPEELDAFWKDAEAVGAGKCKEHLTKTFGYFVGATAIAGSKNLLVLLRGARLGELGVVDPKTLLEQKKVFKLAWCGAEGGAAPEAP
ncbi:MAG: hypothetical protein H0T79_07315 [Deltaproteobacteria bacterium]|nr:hypothetical protein [Deltaproteobacteria bacterium]